MDFSSPLESDKRKDGVLKNAVLFSHADLEPERTPGSFCCLPMRLAAATAAVIIAVGAVVAEEQQDDDQNDDPGTATEAEIVTTTHERFLLVRT